MRFTRRHLVLAGASALCTAALGLGPELAAQSSDEAAIAQAVEAFRNAMLAADRSQFEALCADQLSYGHSAGRIETKAQFIDGATSGRPVWKVMTLKDQSQQIVGDTAIVRHILTGETESEGKTNAVKIGVLWSGKSKTAGGSCWRGRPIGSRSAVSAARGIGGSCDAGRTPDPDPGLVFNQENPREGALPEGPPLPGAAIWITIQHVALPGVQCVGDVNS
jgi:hypothetical protein